MEPRLYPCVILSGAPQRTSHLHTHGRAVERSRHRFYRPCSIREFSKGMPNPWAVGWGQTLLRVPCSQAEARGCKGIAELQRTPCRSMAADESSGSFDFAPISNRGLRLYRCAPLKMTEGEVTQKMTGSTRCRAAEPMRFSSQGLLRPTVFPKKSANKHFHCGE